MGTTYKSSSWTNLWEVLAKYIYSMKRYLLLSFIYIILIMELKYGKTSAKKITKNDKECKKMKGNDREWKWLKMIKNDRKL